MEDAAQGEAPPETINTEDGTPVGRTAVAVGVFAIALYAVIEMQSFPRTGQFVPQVILYPLALLAGANLIREARDLRVYLAVRGRRPRSGDGPSHLEELGAVGWVLGYAVLLFVAGFALSSLLFMLVFLRAHGKESWKVTLITTTVMIGVT